MRALLCHCRQHLEARDDEALFGVVRDHLVRRHPAIPPTDEQVGEIVTTRAYNLEYVLVYASDTAFEEEFGPDPYGEVRDRAANPRLTPCKSGPEIYRESRTFLRAVRV